MCYTYKLQSTKEQIEKRFKSVFKEPELFEKQSKVSGFSYPSMPVITAENPHLLDFFTWGLIPEGSSEIEKIRAMTLNARIETIREKISYRNILGQRCLIPADGFFEWQWQNNKGTKKREFLIKTKTEELFAFAGLYSIWEMPDHGLVKTFTILTTRANPLMQTIHNHGMRMPYILQKEEEKAYLNGEKLTIDPTIDLIAKPIDQQFSLF